jgi:AmmeMemoRadiSam system protein A
MATLTAPSALPPAVSVSDVERTSLLCIARVAIVAAIRRASELGIETAVHRWSTGERCGAAFVTLYNRGELRGCVGHLDSSRPLAESVALAAVGAARRDGRFRPVREPELPDLEIQVSVLGPLVALGDPLAFRLGIDGLLVERGFARGLLLPDVATEHGLDAPAMLDSTCLKAGLAPGAWRDPGTTVFAFRTDRFGGPAVL